MPHTAQGHRVALAVLPLRKLLLSQLCQRLTSVALSDRVSQASLGCIFAAVVQQRVRQSHHLLKENISSFSHRYCEGEDILELCRTTDTPPCLLLRRLLEHPPLSLSRQAIGEVLRNPQLLTKHAVGVPEDLTIRLQGDVKLATECDIVYSPQADALRQAAGEEHEQLLYSRLQALSLPFWSEKDLRSQGFVKTPDVKLQVPFAVHSHIVNWIDSKATFGSDFTHSSQCRGQYQQYINRYGPGAVIYWFGFIEELSQEDNDIMILDSFPAASDLTTLPTLPLPESFNLLVNTAS